MTAPVDPNTYTGAGSPTAPTILFLHGGGVTRAWFQPQINAFSQQFHVLVPDLPGHGVLAARPFTMAAAVKTVADLIEQAAAPVLLVGISLGGYVAIKAAEQLPDRIAGLVLAGCSANFNGLAGIAFRLTALMLRLRGMAWLEEVQLASFRKHVPANTIEPIIAAGFFPAAAVTSMRQIAGKDFHTTAARYPGPTLILNGERETPNRNAEQQLLSRLQNGRIEIIENAGHMTNLEQPVAFDRAVRDFAVECFGS